LAEFPVKYGVTTKQISDWKKQLIQGTAEIMTDKRKNLIKKRQKGRKTVGVFASEESLFILFSALASEISDDSIAGKKYLNMDKLIQEEE
jgi:hypothetical protein